MPGFQDTAVIVILALMLFGPKKLPVLARQLGKLLADFRRASNEFRVQMEEELRISEQAERQKQIAAIEAAAPVTPALEASSDTPHIPLPETASESESEHEPSIASALDEPVMAEPTTAPLPIATSGELNIMPPSTGLPVANTSLDTFLDSIPEMATPETTPNHTVSHESTIEAESPVHG